MMPTGQSDELNMSHNKNLFNLVERLQNAFSLLDVSHPFMMLRQVDAVV